MNPEHRALVEQALAECRERPMSGCSGVDDMEDVLADPVGVTPEHIDSLLVQDPPLMVAKVAARHAYASNFFNVGDPVLFGKYKNKRGIITRIFKDEKGHPSVEITPVPQGRKKPKIMGMYKFWHDADPPDPEEAEEKAKKASERVAERYAATVVLEKKFGRFNVVYLKQHEEHVDKLGALLLEAEKKYESAGVPIVHELSAVLNGRGASHALALYTMGSVPPTMQFAPKSYETADLVHTVIHELGHYFHDKVVPGGIQNPAIISKHMWAVRQKPMNAGSRVDVLNRKLKALNARYFQLNEERSTKKPLPRKGQVFEWDPWVNGQQFHVKGRIVGKRDSRTVNVEIIEAPEGYMKRQQIYRRGPGPLIVPEAIDVLTFVGVDEAKVAELEKVEKERHEVHEQLKAAISTNVDSNDKYKVHIHDWVPTSYARKDHFEYWAEMLTTLVLGHLKPEPAEWVLNVLKTGRAPEAPQPEPTEEPE